MVRGTFANVRIRNLMAPGTEGGVTVKLPEGEPMSIFDAAMAYEQEGTPLIVIGGKEYGTGSSRDWAAKGTKLLGIRAVLVESFERIHRSNLVGMGVLPLQFLPGESAESFGLDGTEVYDITGLASLNHGVTVPKVNVHVTRDNGETFNFDVRLRIDTPTEAEYYRHGGVLNFVLRQLAAS
jgi:aconitate hydratase